ncbi:GNAT family N-acetyltransferase [Pseudoalteromonas mariniglutinosa]|uniref:GNAT family N-acetyltransferase n=1 Tax=Pseudoalteromonas mariniglutinosa TaxID=206042 RepID=UPI00384EA97F
MNKLNSDRFLLRCMNSSDATERYLGWLSSQVSQYILNKPKTIDDLADYIDQQIQDESVYFYGIFTREDHQHIGNVKFIIKGKMQDSVEMGILIGEPAWHGKGVAREVIECFARHAQKQLGIVKMTLGVDLANVAAVNAYEKIGFEKLDDGRTDNGLTMVWNLNGH